MERKEIFLTFDDGPHPEITPWVLSLLEKYGFKATFFCVGDNVRKYPETYQQIIAAGHRTGNHTFNHLKGWKTSLDEYISNVQECRELVDSNLMRPPYGRITKAQTSRLIREYEIIMWTLLSGDFYHGLDCAKAIDKMIRKTSAGQIVVFHDSVKAERNLKEILPPYLEFLSRESYIGIGL